MGSIRARRIFVLTVSKKPPIVARPPGPRSVQFRASIAQAELYGIAREDLILRLTLRDESELKRDPSVATDEISFAGGRMRFLGVTVVAGGVATSDLDRGGR